MENLVIIHTQQDGALSIMSPAIDCGLTIEEIAQKDVPDGVPYRIIYRSEIPLDPTFCEAWVADFSNPDGFGIGHIRWFAEHVGVAEYLEKKAAKNV